MDGALLLHTLLLLSGAGLWKRADSAKITCKVCRDFVVSFDKRLEDTSTSSYAGGDTSWEEENLGAYSDSEVRLVEVLDSVCKKSDYACHSLLEVAEEDIEKWWLTLRRQQKEQSDLEQWLCFAHLDVCCPDHTFGSTCQHCPGAPGNTCGGRGKCEGAGEKDGVGTCACDMGYGGHTCQACADRFYQESPNEEGGDSDPLECKECDKSCAQSCEGPGPGDCDGCGEGYEEDGDLVCRDVNECKLDGDTHCKEGSYCFNTPGSFRCNDCDKACKKICNGPGPAKCAVCAVGYSENDHGVCRDDDECEGESAECSHGTYCENTPGKYVCKACHVACLDGCHGVGAKGCVACKEGYVMSVEDGCEDIDECEDSPGPCDSETEVCSNLPGTYTCKCRAGHVKGEEGRCVTQDQRDQQRDQQREAKKTKKKRRKKKQASKATEGGQERRGVAQERRGEDGGVAEGEQERRREEEDGDVAEGGQERRREEDGDLDVAEREQPQDSVGAIKEFGDESIAESAGKAGLDGMGAELSAGKAGLDGMGAELSAGKAGLDGMGAELSADYLQQLLDDRDEL